MRIVSAALVMLMLFGVTASARPMGLYKSDEIMALGKILKVDKEVLNDGKITLDYWYVAYEKNLYYCVTNRGTALYIECYDKRPLD
jgi:hypothetical protein